jgi:hypothetical protein
MGGLFTHKMVVRDRDKRSEPEGHGALDRGYADF